MSPEEFWNVCGFLAEVHSVISENIVGGRPINLEHVIDYYEFSPLTRSSIRDYAHDVMSWYDSFVKQERDSIRKIWYIQSRIMIGAATVGCLLINHYVDNQLIKCLSMFLVSLGSGFFGYSRKVTNTLYRLFLQDNLRNHIKESNEKLITLTNNLYYELGADEYLPYSYGVSKN